MSAILTDAQIRSLKPTGKRREIADGRISGLYLIVQPSGAKSWATRYRVAGVPRKLTIGPYPGIDLATARRRAQEALGDVAKGSDPSAQKKAARAAAKATAAAIDERVENVVDDFIRLYAMKKTRDWRETNRLLQKDVVPAWQGRLLSEIGKKHVVKLLDEIVERGAPIGANRTFAQIRKMCGWAVGRGIIERNPCEGVEPPSAEVERERVLTNDELSLVWRAADALGYPFGPIVRLLIVTGQRRNEVAGIGWGELALDEATWTIPKDRAKNGREHHVPLPDVAIEMLRALPRVAGGDLAFSPRSTAPSGYSAAKIRLDREIAAINDGQDIAPWTLHDLRRTVATGMAELRIAPHVVEAVLNHKSGTIKGVARIYNRYSYANEKRSALDAWARRLDAIVTGATAGNIVELATARG